VIDVSRLHFSFHVLCDDGSARPCGQCAKDGRLFSYQLAHSSTFSSASSIETSNDYC